MPDWKYYYDTLTRIISFIQRNPILSAICFILFAICFILFTIGFTLFTIGFLLLFAIINE